MEIIINWLIGACAVMISAYLLPGIHVKNFLAALLIALVLGIVNATLKPILILLTFPINILTLGLFTLVINALLVLLTTLIVSNFKVDSFWWALGFGILLSIVNSFIHKCFSNYKKS